MAFIECRNSHAKYNSDFRKNQATQSMLSLAVKSLVEDKDTNGTMLSQDAVDRCEFVNDIDFIDNVQRLMRLLRPMSFTVNEYDKRTIQ